MHISRNAILALGALMFVMASPAVRAANITYAFTTTATGTLDGHAFSSALLTITAVAAGSSPVPFSTTVTVGAFSDSFNTRSPYVYAQPSCPAFSGEACVGFGADSGDIVDVGNPALTGYVLGTPIGPITSTSAFNPGPGFPYVDDTGGTLVLNSQSAATFTANTAPEPGSVFLLELGLTAMLIVWRRRRTA